MSDKQQEELQSAYKKMLKAVRLIESADMDLARAFDTANYPKVESMDTREATAKYSAQLLM